MSQKELRKKKPKLKLKIKQMILDEVASFTEEERQKLQAQARAVWEYIGYEVLLATIEEGEDNTVDRETVIELVIDADRMRDQVRDPALKALVDRFYKVSYDAMQEIIRPGFLHEHYGM